MAHKICCILFINRKSRSLIYFVIVALASFLEASLITISGVVTITQCWIWRHICSLCDSLSSLWGTDNIYSCCIASMFFVFIFEPGKELEDEFWAATMCESQWRSHMEIWIGSSPRQVFFLFFFVLQISIIDGIITVNPCQLQWKEEVILQ